MRINLFELEGQRALVSRGAARRIGTALSERLQLEGDGEPVVLDFGGVEAASPSFFDELVASLAELKGPARRTVQFVQVPASVPNTFQAISRGRAIEIAEKAPECWEVELPARAETPASENSPDV